MSHPSEGELLSFVDGALDLEERRHVHVHAQGCATCRHALHGLEQAMRGLTVELALVDAGEPAAWRDALPAPKSVGGSFAPRSVLPRDAVRPPLRSLEGWRAPRASLRWAAVLLVLVAGGATAMVAPRWRAMRTTGLPAAASAAREGVIVDAPVATTAAAVSILPDGGRATVALASGDSASGGRVRVLVSDRLDVQVTVTTPVRPAPSTGQVPRFSSADGRLDVQLAERDAEILVELPASLRSARITHDGRTVVTVQAGEVRPAGATTEGVALLPAARP